ncbi:NAD(P)-dependent dehydrogenase (short-subunit alcohol dehydrogenase family) [Cytobacillus eiseniae]|uniref:NAD(P)-dependent dehydrogenase (Short-subunit alcohol dehydrogenase family) n=1 Tax=Cytobacillus eiseniae TaxID=762947 RepID=A0ABS4RJ43_9BACI|nr:SDR family oxidoreductase [Cytobacillus eiseniae]MBP2242749.1 NAD(P)-dependent dehydrogenase (short-subunit alcohol dehydrogenase family) [Cytobacillus eiseniae]
MNNQKVVMITGASRGLGKALALAFAKEGVKLAICSRGEEALRKVEQEVRELGGEVIAVNADVSNVKDVNRFVSIVEEAFGQVDIVINNASIFGSGPVLLADYPDHDFANVLRVNVINPFLVTKRVLPSMLIRNKGRILNVTSEAGKTGFAEWGAYGISKFAVEGLTQTWADELQESGVNMGMVDPGEMDTEMHLTAVPDCDYELGDPHEVANVFVALALDEKIEVNGKRFEAQSLLQGRRDVQ